MTPVAIDRPLLSVTNTCCQRGTTVFSEIPLLSVKQTCCYRQTTVVSNKHLLSARDHCCERHLLSVRYHCFQWQTPVVSEATVVNKGQFCQWQTSTVNKWSFLSISYKLCQRQTTVVSQRPWFLEGLIFILMSLDSLISRLNRLWTHRSRDRGSIPGRQQYFPPYYRAQNG